MAPPKKPLSASTYIRQQLSKEQPPHDKLFKRADRAATQIEKKRFKALKRYIRAHGLPRPDENLGPFQPFLLIRSVLSDHGARPLTAAQGEYEFFSQVPDIWFAQGDPSATPAIPAPPQPSVDRIELPKHSGTMIPYTIYAHVWNLGRAPIGAAKVEFFAWFATPNVDHIVIPPLPPNDAERIGIARIDLPPRTSPNCHQLVKCPNALLVPVPANPLATRLAVVAQISGLGDPVTSQFGFFNDRHVARRDIFYHSH
jgi:hypothetical protein